MGLRKFFSKLKIEVIYCPPSMEGTSSSFTEHDDRQPSNSNARELTRTDMKLDNHDHVEDFDFLSRDDHAEEILKISDETYAEKLQLQEVLLYSSLVDGEIDNDNYTLLRNLKQKETFEEGESSSSSSSSQLEHSYCAICMEAKHVEEMFENRIYSHSFCQECVGSYLAAKIQENIAMVKCPDPKCNDIIEPYDCITIIPKEVFERWENALCENSVLASQKMYCPYNNCSAMLVNDLKGVVTVSECLHCHRLLCAQCKVPWHAKFDCREFQSLKVDERGREDLMAIQLAKNKRWKRCPKCSIFVEKKDGCTHISCRCGHEFCYGCGSTWNDNYHYKCATQ